MPTMEEVVAMHNAKPMPILKSPKIFRFKFFSFKRLNNGYSNKYWRIFELVYLHKEVNTFEKTIGWYPRYLTLKIPKVLNHLIKFVFGKRLYSVSRTYDNEITCHTDFVDRKSKNNYIKEFKENKCTNIYVIFKKIEYDGWLFTPKAEKKHDSKLLNSQAEFWS